MRIVDSGIDQRKDDTGASFRNIPGLGRVNVGPRGPTVLPSIVEIPLLGEPRVVREGQILNRMDDIVRLGVKNVWVLAVTVQSSLQGSVGGKLDKVQSFGDLELPLHRLHLKHEYSHSEKPSV